MGPDILAPEPGDHERTMNPTRVPLRAALLALVLLAAPCGLVQMAAAQAAPPLARGTRVRVVAPALRGQAKPAVSGELVSLHGDTVVVWPLDRAGVPVADGPQRRVLSGGRRLELVAGTHGNAGKGFLLGAGIGALSGAAIGFAIWQPCQSTQFMGCMLAPGDRWAAAGYGAVGGMLGGAVLGFVIGVFTRTDTWVTVQTGGVRVALTPGGMGFSVAF